MTMKFRNMAFMFAFAMLVSALHSDAAARTWTRSELDTLTSHKWIWVDKGYKEVIVEYYSETDRPDQLPQHFRYVSPSFPDEAERSGVEGSVWLSVVIDEKGKVRAARVLKDSELKVGFEDAALSAAKKSIWKPAIKDSRRVSVSVAYEVAFYHNKTDDGRPIKKISPWHWLVRNADLLIADSANWQVPKEDSAIDSDTLIEGIEPPTTTKDGFLQYPKGAMKFKIEGSVWVKVLLNERGLVSEAKVAKESGCDYGFEESALWGAVNSKWKPAMMGKDPIPIWVTYEIAFKFVE